MAEKKSLKSPKKTTAKVSTAKKTTAKKTTAKVSTAKKTTAKKPTAKVSTTKKPAAAKVSTAKKPAAKKPAAKVSTTKKTTAKKPAAAKKPAEVAAPPPAPVDPQQLRRDSAKELAKRVAAAGLDKKAERIEIIDIGEKVDYADYLVLMSGRSDRQVQSISGGIEDALKQQGQRPHSVEGMSQGHWVIVDYGDVIVHVFQEEARRYYDLDSLWLDARRVPFENGTRPSMLPPA